MESVAVKNQFARSPTLGTILMIEKVIERHSGELTRTEVWKKLPNKVMWQTFLVVIDYLETNNKILVDKEGKVVWIWNPALIRKLENQGLVRA